MVKRDDPLDTSLATLRQVGAQTRPSGFLDYKLYLDNLYYQAKLHIKPYSYKKFAADLGFGPTTVVHQIVNGYRPLTARAAARIAGALSLSSTERRYLELLVTYCNQPAAKNRATLFSEMVQIKAEAAPVSTDKDWLSYCSAWYHVVIRELVATREFRPDAQWIATRILRPITPEQVSESLDLLERLQMIRYDKVRQVYMQTTERVDTGSAVRGLGLVRFHQEMIDHGRAALSEVPGRRRHVSGLTFHCDEQAIDTLKAMISEFQARLLDLAESAPGDEVFQLNMQLFPFTGGRET